MAALFLLVLVLMVMATLSLSHLTHQKMQMQVASDTAAYSQAVATARAYNSVALLNRAQLATMVTLAGVDSAVSFAGSYRAALNATWYAYWNEFDLEYCDGTERVSGASYPPVLCEGPRLTTIDNCRRARRGEDAIDRGWCYGEACRVRLEITGYGGLNGGGNDFLPTARHQLILKEFDRVKDVWQDLDEAAGLQARSVQSEAANYAGLQNGALDAARTQLPSFVAGSLAVVGAVPNGGAIAVAEREFGDGVGGGVTDNGIDAAMGSRAHTFITQRADGQRAIQAALRRVLAPSGGANEVTVNAMRGNGYFATTKNHGARPATAFAAWGDEESSVSVNYAGPDAQIGAPGTASGNLRFEGWVGSTDRQNTTDSHGWCPEDFKPDANPPDERHTMHPHAVPPGGLPDPCAASSCIWPSFVDTNSGKLTDVGDVYGQPKLLASATRDLSGVNKPWNMFLNYQFVPNGPGAQTDFRAKHAVAGVQPELQAVSAAMAYYHRPNHWKEPPNFFNPYWRATLVRANIDDTWAADFSGAISPSNGAALSALLNAGYRGIP